MFRRKRGDDPTNEPTDAVDDADRPVDPRADGPWDASEVEIDPEDGSRLDLGSLLVVPHEGLELQLQVDEASGEVIAVVMAGEQGAVELRAFAAPRNGDIWAGVRASMTEEIAAMGGTAAELEGPWGTELAVSLTVQLEDGRTAEQPSKVVGITGPRWLLRATLFGRPAMEHLPDGDIERALRDVVVVRGGTPVPPGDALPLTMPPDITPVADQTS